MTRSIAFAKRHASVFASSTSLALVLSLAAGCGTGLEDTVTEAPLKAMIATFDLPTESRPSALLKPGRDFRGELPSRRLITRLPRRRGPTGSAKFRARAHLRFSG